MMLTVGIYGRIGSGKSEITKVFAERGAAVISADQIGKDVVERNPAVLDQLVAAFGSGILGSDGRLDRRETGRIAFSSPDNLRRLDSIVHPLLLEELRAQIEKYRRSRKVSILVLDAALILRWGIESEFVVLVCVTAPEDDVIELLAQNGLDSDEVRKRLDMQIPADQQAAKADFVIENDGTLAELREKARRLYKQIASGENTV